MPNWLTLALCFTVSLATDVPPQHVPHPQCAAKLVSVEFYKADLVYVIKVLAREMGRIAHLGPNVKGKPRRRDFCAMWPLGWETCPTWLSRRPEGRSGFGGSTGGARQDLAAEQVRDEALLEKCPARDNSEWLAMVAAREEEYLAMGS